MGKSAMFCVEHGFEEHLPAFKWALTHLLSEGDHAHLVTVIPPLDFTPVSGGPMAGYAASAVAQQYEMQTKRSEARAAETLKQAVDVVQGLDLKLASVHTHALGASGGASGVGSSLVEYANQKNVDVAVLGSRGGGAVQRSLRSVVGLGSVSDYAVHNMHCPVLVVRHGCLETFTVAQPEEELLQGESAGAAAPKRKIAIAVDASEHSKEMLRWALDHLVVATDELHVISVASPVEYPVLDDTSPGVCAMETQYWQDAKAESLKRAEANARAAVDMAGQQGVPLDHIWFKGLSPEGGASGVGDSILHYVKANKNNMLVVGNRGLGGFKRAMSNLLGLGSVSDYAVHNAPCPVLVYKH